MSEAASTTPHQSVAAVIGKIWWLPLVRGTMLLILGGYALIRPGMTMGVLTQVVGAFVIADGFFSILACFQERVPSRGWGIVRGLLEVLIGAFVFANPIIVAGISATILIYSLAFSAILSGVLEIIAAIQDRKHLEGEGWLILGGALSVLFGVLLVMSPLSFGLFMVRVPGVFAIFFAVSLIVFAFRLRGLGRKLNEDSED